MSRSVGRRCLLTAGALLAVGLRLRGAVAMGRVPLGGELRLRVPWATASLDPHDLGDPLAALFGHALADPVYALDPAGRSFPALADGMPWAVGPDTLVRLRPGLRTGQGKVLGGRDLVWSIERSRRMGAGGWLGPLDGPVRIDRDDPLLVHFGAIAPDALAWLLASPLVALLPVGFSPKAPDGTGALRGRCSSSALELERNPLAARGPSFLDRVLVGAAPDLSDSLRAFEAGHDEIGWLGLGLHGERAGARRFAYGEVGWVVLATGKAAGRFAQPGVAQQLANAVPIERLGHLGLGPRSNVGRGIAWAGGPATIVLEQQQPQLEAVAKAVAAALSQPGHELAVSSLPAAELRRSLQQGDFALGVHLVRRLGPGALGIQCALATAERAALGRDLARHPPRLPSAAQAHTLTGALRLGVLGGLAVSGGVAPGAILGAAPPALGGLDLGASYRHG